MKHNREFEIAWLGLKVGEHVYEFSIGDEFMRERGAPAETHDWNAQVKLRFDRQQSFFRLHFDISGSVVVPCDRCGDEFPLSLWDEFSLLIKLTGEDEDEKETDDEADVAFVSRHETVIDISGWIYEFVMLSLPLQRVHPEGQCNPEAIRLLTQLDHAEDAPEHDIWKGLKDIKIEEEDNNAKGKSQKVKKDQTGQ
jgi:uncharacterized metal-binding protein YceD (DUF177 family)